VAYPFPSRTARQDVAVARLRAVTGVDTSGYAYVADAGPPYGDAAAAVHGGLAGAGIGAGAMPVEADDGWPWPLDPGDAAPDAADPPGDSEPSGRAARTLPRIRRTLSMRAAWWAFLDSGRRGIAAVVAIGVLAAVVASVGFLRSRPEAFPVDGPVTASSARLVQRGGASSTPGVGSALPRPAATAVAAVPSATPAPSAAVLVVDVAGKVRHPGIVRLPPGARVADAVQAAGGPLPGTRLGLLNLASPLSDGEQVVVGLASVAGGDASGVVAGAPGSTLTGAPAGAAASPSGEAPVDLNTASLEQLETLPRVGPVLAQRIVDFRTSHGAFRSVDELQQVPGIGPSTMADLRGLVTV
jgi:competence protein ComEA